eukprot:1157677-Pelagomonas_calceolata.AAC.9
MLPFTWSACGSASNTGFASNGGLQGIYKDSHHLASLQPSIHLLPGLKSGERSATSPRLGGALAALLQLVLFQLGVSAGLGAVSNCTRPMPPVPGRPPTDAPLCTHVRARMCSDQRARLPSLRSHAYILEPANSLQSMSTQNSSHTPTLSRAAVNSLCIPGHHLFSLNHRTCSSLGGTPGN